MTVKTIAILKKVTKENQCDVWGRNKIPVTWRYEKVTEDIKGKPQRIQ
jgi:hypothetical protein